jgi:hypothetical protein
VDLGIFEPVAGRIVYWSDGSLWAIDPDASTPGSTLVRIGDEGQFEPTATPLGWSSDCLETSQGKWGVLRTP